MTSIMSLPSAMFLLVLTATFDYMPDSQPVNSSDQTKAQDVVEKKEQPKTQLNKKIKKNNSQAVKKSVKKMRKQISGQKKLERNYTSSYKSNSQRFKISGYFGQTFVYGEVYSHKDGKVEGYIYHPKNSRTYVYGEQSKDRINLYDSSGNLYQMLYQ